MEQTENLGGARAPGAPPVSTPMLVYGLHTDSIEWEFPLATDIMV